MHSIVEEGVRLGVVQEVEFHLEVSGGVGDSEEEPLGVTFGVDVVLDQEGVLVIGDFGGHAQVS